MQLPELLGSAVQHGEGCFVGNLLFSGLNVVAEHTDQDVKDYIAAANTILKEHGMEPLKLGSFWFRKALIDAKEEVQR